MYNRLKLVGFMFFKEPCLHLHKLILMGILLTYQDSVASLLSVSVALVLNDSELLLS